MPIRRMCTKVLYTYISQGKCNVIIIYTPRQSDVIGIINKINKEIFNAHPDQPASSIRKIIDTSISDISTQRRLKKTGKVIKEYVYIFNADNSNDNKLLEINTALIGGTGR